MFLICFNLIKILSTTTNEIVFVSLDYEINARPNEPRKNYLNLSKLILIYIDFKIIIQY